MVVLNFWFPKLYGEESSAQVSRIKDMCYDLLNDYQQIKLRDAQPTAPSIGTTAIIDDVAEFDAYVETIAVAGDSSSSVKSWLWAAENNGIFRVAEEIATVLNEMESDDEAELMEGCLGYHFED
ncbi:unnamed protein product [Vicia faba]|uniref:Uncharacterized protein n=1 Tax=Vicia faba TaxID=3906 RepID=A0AAV0YCQ4_VICFA|nr:unnamed protein product [Vicia faba]